MTHEAASSEPLTVHNFARRVEPGEDIFDVLRALTDEVEAKLADLPPSSEVVLIHVSTEYFDMGNVMALGMKVAVRRPGSGSDMNRG